MTIHNVMFPSVLGVGTGGKIWIHATMCFSFTKHIHCEISLIWRYAVDATQCRPHFDDTAELKRLQWMSTQQWVIKWEDGELFLVLIDAISLTQGLFYFMKRLRECLTDYLFSTFSPLNRNKNPVLFGFFSKVTITRTYVTHGSKYSNLRESVPVCWLL